MSPLINFLLQSSLSTILAAVILYFIFKKINASIEAESKLKIKQQIENVKSEIQKDIENFRLKLEKEKHLNQLKENVLLETIQALSLCDQALFHIINAYLNSQDPSAYIGEYLALMTKFAEHCTMHRNTYLAKYIDQISAITDSHNRIIDEIHRAEEQRRHFNVNLGEIQESIKRLQEQLFADLKM